MTQQPDQPPQPPQGQPYYVYPQPPKKDHTLRTVLIAVGAALFVLVAGIAGCTALVATGTPDDTGHTQVAPTDNGGAPTHPKKEAAKKPTHDPAKYGWWYDAKKDVTVSGIASADEYSRYVVFSVTNQSDKTLDYDINLAYYNDEGVRIDTDTAYVDTVAPGEKVNGTEYDTFVDPGAKTVKILTVGAAQS